MGLLIIGLILVSKKVDDLFSFLDYLFPNSSGELIYNKDYELLIAVVLSAQCTDKRVNKITKILFDKYNSLEKLKNACLEDIIFIIKPLGSFNKKAKYILEISNYLFYNCNSKVPNSREILESLPGVGRKTCNVVLAELFNVPLIAVDTHVKRVSKRLLVDSSLDDVIEIEKKLMNLIPKDKWIKFHHEMVLFGRYFCKSKKPMCDKCKLKKYCKYYNNL